MLLPSPASLPSPKTSALPLFSPLSPLGSSVLQRSRVFVLSLCSPSRSFSRRGVEQGGIWGLWGSQGSPRGCDSAAATAGRVLGDTEVPQTLRCPLCVPHTPNPSTFGAGGPRGLQSPNWGRRGPELGVSWGLHNTGHAQDNPPALGSRRENRRGKGEAETRREGPLRSLECHQEPPGTSGHLVLPGAGAEQPDGA